MTNRSKLFDEASEAAWKEEERMKETAPMFSGKLPAFLAQAINAQITMARYEAAFRKEMEALGLYEGKDYWIEY